jgi:hypothetical protein
MGLAAFAEQMAGLPTAGLAYRNASDDVMNPSIIV